MIQATWGLATFGSSEDSNAVGSRTGAWDEIAYAAGSDPVAAMTAFTASPFDPSISFAGVNIIRTGPLGLRLAALSKSCFVYYIRMAVVGQRRSAVLVKCQLTGKRAECNTPSTALAYRIWSPSRQVYRYAHLRGLQDDWVNDNAIVKPGDVDKYATPFLVAMRDAFGAQIKYRTSEIGGENSVRFVGATVAQDTFLTLTLQAAFTLSPGVRVVISDVRGYPQLRGMWQVVSQNTAHTEVTLKGSQRINVPANITGQLTRYLTDGVSWSNIDAPSLTDIKLGKKKYLQRGRRSPQILRH